jgi:ABC transporter substrate binding protein (PQQ-dependent alcohol dehydrogenase system)
LEQWGALQLQNRFTSEHGRGMTSADYGAWLAVRAVAEAVTRTGSSSAENIYDYLVSEEFELAAFLGRSLTFRSWNGQIRQPITLVQPKAAVSQSPQTGFLHPGTELDTLGFDAPEVNCRFKG